MSLKMQETHTKLPETERGNMEREREQREQNFVLGKRRKKH